MTGRTRTHASCAAEYDGVGPAAASGDPWEDPGTGLCLPQEQVQERIYNVNQDQAILYGLIFSGVAGSALTPSAAAEFDQGSTHRLLSRSAVLPSIRRMRLRTP